MIFLKYQLIYTDHSSEEHLHQLMHPYFFKGVYEDIKEHSKFIDFVCKNRHKKWFIFSDYCLDDKNKPNNVLTFSVVAISDIDQLNLLKNIIEILQPKDIKKSKMINPNFMKFISSLPIFNISIIVPKNRNFIKAFKFDEIEYFKMRYKSLENYYCRLHNFPINNHNFINIIKDLRYVQKKFNAKSISLNKFRDIEIITSVISTISILISIENVDSPTKIIWVSDRDSLLTFEKSNLSMPLIFNIAHATFRSFLKTKSQLLFYNYIDECKPEYDSFNRIPDIVAGSLADMSPKTVTNKKFIPILKDYLTLECKNYVAKLYFEEKKYGLNQLKLEKS